MVQVFEELLNKLGFINRILFQEININGELGFVSGIRCDDWKEINGKRVLLPEKTYVYLTIPERNTLAINIEGIDVLMDKTGKYHIKHNF